MSKTGQGNYHANYQTRDAAAVLAPLLPFLPAGWKVWECCAGSGRLGEGLRAAGRSVLATGIAEDFYEHEPSADAWDVIVTNPPFDQRLPMMRRAQALGKAWCFLLPYNTFETKERQEFLASVPLTFIPLPKRPAFLREDGSRPGSNPYPCGWFCNLRGASPPGVFFASTPATPVETLPPAEASLASATAMRRASRSSAMERRERAEAEVSASTARAPLVGGPTRP